MARRGMGTVVTWCITVSGATARVGATRTLIAHPCSSRHIVRNTTALMVSGSECLLFWTHSRRTLAGAHRGHRPGMRWFAQISWIQH